MEYRDYVRRLREHASIAEIFEYGRVREAGEELPLLGLTLPGRSWLVLTAGFHGEEPAGPLTLLTQFGEIAALARARNVGLRVYPCINPSGFEAGTRYNASGERPNNDFLRYEVSPGTWKGELQPGETFLRWKLYTGGPKETQALRAEITRWPAPSAALDLHQDNYLGTALTYAYTFGDKAAYRPLMRAASAHAPVAAETQVDEQHRTDADGLIESHDGSITDYFLREGVPHAAALETTTATPLEACHAVNLAWIRGFIELAAEAGQRRS